MKNIVYCKKCKKEIIIDKNQTDKYSLSRKLGKDFELTCPYCNTTATYNINKVYAKSNISFNLLILSITILASVFISYYTYNLTKSTVYLYYLLPTAIMVPWFIFFVFESEQRKKIRNFNKHRI